MKAIITVLLFSFNLYSLSELKYTVSPEEEISSLKEAVDSIRIHHSDLVSEDIYAIIEITGDWTSDDTLQPDFTNIITDNNHEITVVTVENARHRGKWDTTAHRLVSVKNDNTYLRIDHVRFNGLQFGIKNPSSATSFFRTIGLSNTDTVVFDNCIFKGHNNSSYRQNLISVSTGSKPKQIYRNCISYNWGGNSLSYYNQTNSNDSVYIYNSTFVFDGAFAGIRREKGLLVVKNTYSSNQESNAYLGTVSMTACASDDATGSEGYKNWNLNEINFTDTSEGKEDFSLPSGSALIDTGEDLSDNGITSDITGISRPQGKKYDIGAFEFGSEWDSISLDSVGIKRNGNFIKLTMNDSIYWKDVLRYWGIFNGLQATDSFYLGDVICSVIDSSDTTIDIIVPSGVSASFVKFIIRDTISADTCTDPDSVWLVASLHVISIDSVSPRYSWPDSFFNIYSHNWSDSVSAFAKISSTGLTLHSFGNPKKFKVPDFASAGLYWLKIGTFTGTDTTVADSLKVRVLGFGDFSLKPGDALRMEWYDGLLVDIYVSWNNKNNWTLIENNYQTGLDLEKEGPQLCRYDWISTPEPETDKGTTQLYYKVVDKLNLQNGPYIKGPFIILEIQP